MEKVVHVQKTEVRAVTNPAMPEPVASEPVVKPFPKDNKNKMLINLVLSIVVIFAGVGTGWVASRVNAGESEKSDTAVMGLEAVSDAIDEEVFNESAQGMLLEGGIEGEGTHRLDRGLGEEKMVYLISSVIDLQSFVGKKVEIRGKSVAGNKAGWLMDVVKVKLMQ
ncbi:hypothetical protein C4564_01965 [Candidatus Microgenomates bacterium]|nr:MAG: hypothetical protein C4564_01965 [Candidatus Microgenomates bacterium]